MNISAIQNQPVTPSAIRSAEQGINIQTERLERNVVEVAQNPEASSGETNSRDKALIEQLDIVNSLRANARSLEASHERLGTLIDLEA